VPFNTFGEYCANIFEMFSTERSRVQGIASAPELVAQPVNADGGN
jgi:hypothetical protein